MASDRLRVEILTEYFYPEESATAQLLTELATGLAERGFEVGAITGQPSYHDADREQQVPREETHEGVRISRVKATQFDKDVLPLRIINWLTYTLLTTIRLLRTDEDAVLVVSNPPILPVAAWLNCRLFGTPYVYLIHDVYPDIAVQLGLLSEGSLLTRGWRRVMRLFYRDADRIVVLGESMEQYLESEIDGRPAVDPEKIEVIPNWEDGEFITPKPKSENDFAQEHSTRESFTLVYSGNIGRFHELETAIKAVERLADEGYDVKFLIIGEGARKDELRQMVREREMECVSFLPFQPYEKLPETLTCGDASLVGIKSEMEGLCVSSKLYSSLAAGRPILAVVGDGDEVARVVKEAECGTHVTPGDVASAESALRSWIKDDQLRRRLGANARRCFEASYTQEQAVSAYEDMFDDLLNA